MSSMKSLAITCAALALCVAVRAEDPTPPNADHITSPETRHSATRPVVREQAEETPHGIHKFTHFFTHTIGHPIEHGLTDGADKISDAFK